MNLTWVSIHSGGISDIPTNNHFAGQQMQYNHSKVCIHIYK